MVIPPTRAEVEAALASGFTIHYRRGELRFITDGGEHDIELDALGAWLRDIVLAANGGPVWPSSDEPAPPSPSDTTSPDT